MVQSLPLSCRGDVCSFRGEIWALVSWRQRRRPGGPAVAGPGGSPPAKKKKR